MYVSCDEWIQAQKNVYVCWDQRFKYEKTIKIIEAKSAVAHIKID